MYNMGREGLRHATLISSSLATKMLQFQRILRVVQ